MPPDQQIDLSRWRERPRGIGYRRLTIVRMGLTQLLRTKLLAILVLISWVAGLGIAALGYLVSQSVATGGWLEQAALKFPGQLQAFVAIIGGMLTLFPDVWIHSIYTAIFWLHSFAGMTLSLVALTLVIPHLISRDRGTGAMVIYLSRPINSTDYLLAKLGIVAGVLLLTWIGPLLFGWLASLLVAPNADFIVYSIAPLLRALAYAGIAFVVLAALALAVSALNKTSGGAITTWIGLWLVAGAIANFPDSPDWLRRTSFSYDLQSLRKEAFRLDTALLAVANSMPLPSKQFTDNMATAAKVATPDSPTGALIGLVIFTAASSFVFTRRIRPE